MSLRLSGGKAHRERAQPKARQARFGLLEKKKDYRLRARDYHAKQTRLRRLRELADERNPDEFAKAMISAARAGQGASERVQGISKDKRKGEAEVMKMLFTQGSSYLATRRQMERRKVEKMRANLHMVRTKAQSSHTVFVDSDSEAEDFDETQHFETLEEFEGSAFRPSREAAERADFRAVVNTDAPKAKAVERAKRKEYGELIERTKRADKLDAAAAALQQTQNMMGKGRRYKVREGDVDSGELAVYKWKKTRKR
jgi:U3 small nucleolar RNA-associated protein 11